MFMGSSFRLGIVGVGLCLDAGRERAEDAVKNPAAPYTALAGVGFLFLISQQNPSMLRKKPPLGLPEAATQFLILRRL